MTTHAPTRAVVFDLDGTLLDTMGSAPRAYAVVLTQFLGRPSSPDNVEHFHRQFEAAVDGVEPFPGIAEMLDGLAFEGYRLGLFTAATRRAAEPLLAATGLAPYFETTLCGDEVDEPKPAAEGLERACRDLDVLPTAAAYVGDTTYDLRCARNAGATGIHAAWGGAPVATDETQLVAHHPRDVIALLGSRR